MEIWGDNLKVGDTIWYEYDFNRRNTLYNRRCILCIRQQEKVYPFSFPHLCGIGKYSSFFEYSY